MPRFPSPPPTDHADKNVTPQMISKEKDKVRKTACIHSPSERDLSTLSKYEERFDDGYDYDGMIGPFWDCQVDEGDQDFEEEILEELRGEGQDKVEVTILDGFEINTFDVDELPP